MAYRRSYSGTRRGYRSRSSYRAPARRRTTRRTTSRRRAPQQTLRIILEQPTAALGRESIGLKPATGPRKAQF